MSKKKWYGIEYDPDVDYSLHIAEAEAKGDYEEARLLAVKRFAKIKGEGLAYTQPLPEFAVTPTTKAKAEPKATRRSILDAAMKCVTGDREQDYGSPEDNFRTIANLWGVYLWSKNPEVRKVIAPNALVTPVDVAALLSLLKIARIASGHAKEDNWIDLAGYAACGGELQGRLKENG